MRTTAAKRIARTGYALRTKGDMVIGETWVLCNERGYQTHYSAEPLNTQECHGLVCAGALRRCEVIRLTGGIVYRLVTT